jgi:uncharacterized membrane protein YgcG
MMKYLAALTLFGGLIVLQSSGHAHQPPAPVPVATIPIQAQPTAKIQRAHYTVRHIDATALASVVGKHFKGEAEVLAVPTASGNTLLISGSPDSIGEVFRLLEQLDRKPRTVEVEIVIADITSKKGPDGKEVDLSGLEPLAKLDALTKAGAGAVQRIKLTAVEGQPITSTAGGSKPYVSGTMVAGGGGGGGFGGDGGFGGGKGGGPAGGGGGPMMRRSITYHETGTTVKLTARIGAEDVVALDLNIQDSKIRAPEAGDEIGAAAFDNNTLNTKLSVPPGKAVAAQAVRTEGKTGGTMSLVIVTAHVVEPGAGKSK